MLSIEECRELIPNNRELTDKQIDELRGDIIELGELALEKWMKEKE